MTHTSPSTVPHSYGTVFGTCHHDDAKRDDETKYEQQRPLQQQPFAGIARTVGTQNSFMTRN